VNEDNLSNVRTEASRYFRNKKREYLKDKINETELNSKNKNITDKFTIQTGLKQGDTFIIIVFQLCSGICHQEGPREPGGT
jgi:hypothetical protein